MRRRREWLSNWIEAARCRVKRIKEIVEKTKDGRQMSGFNTESLYKRPGANCAAL
jgi:hypothetical protein